MRRDYLGERGGQKEKNPEDKAGYKKVDESQRTSKLSLFYCPLSNGKFSLCRGGHSRGSMDGSLSLFPEFRAGHKQV